ncbi:AMP-binding protein [Streptomyces parvulus]|uniref:sodium:solute symporter family transporter n=1 Tax=Streptomyces parvulus TaxID=146923 RepID=UPI0037036948
MLNLSVLLEDSARTHPDRDAVVLGTTRLTYAQVEAAANRVANLLVDRGIWPGDKVALSCPNVPWFPIVYYGILKAGAVVVPLNILLKSREIAYHLADSEAKAYFCFEGDAGLAMGAEGHAGFTETAGCEHFFLVTADPEAHSPIEGVETMGAALQGSATTFDSMGTTGDDPAVLLYTSGTTGQAKGAELSHANLVLNALACNRLLENRPALDTHLVVLPLFHSFGATVQMNAGFSTASTLVLLPRFDARQTVSLMQREEITFFAGVPTMWWGLLQALTEDVDVARIAKNLRVGVSGGACRDHQAGLFYLLLITAGVAAAAVVGSGQIGVVDVKGQGAPILLASEVLPHHSTGRVVVIVLVACVAFLAVLTAVASVTFAAAVSVARDLFGHKGRSRIGIGEPAVMRLSVVALFAVSLLLATALYRYPIEFLLAFSLSLAATCVFPALVYSFLWTGFNRRGLLWLVYGGLSLCALLTLTSPAVSGTKYALLPEQDFNLIPLHTPGLISVPAAFLLGWLGSARPWEGAARTRRTALREARSQ